MAKRKKEQKSTIANPPEYDVIVAGGGPAGATVAGYLAKEGYKVLVLEKEKFPRHIIGESLLPSAMPILEELGVLEEVEKQNFPKKTGGTFIWGKEKEPWSVLFSANPFLPYPYAYHVDRALFDKIMLDNSARLGAEVREGYAVDEAIMEDGRVVGLTARQGKKGSKTESFRAKVVVDASGRASILGKKLTDRVFDPQMNQVAFFTYYNNVKGPKIEEQEGHVIVESHPRGWVWYIPLFSKTVGDVSVGVVSGAEFKGEWTEKGVEQFYEDSIAECPYLEELLGPDAERVDKVHAITDWAYSCDRMAGPGFFLAGDAACFLDPLLSTGVSMAMLSGYSAAACINSIFKNPELEEEATSFYSGNYSRMWDVTRDFLHYFYAGNASAYPEDMFWKARGTLKLGENVGARQAFCFLVNTIPANPHPALRKQIHMFMQFMDNIEHPTMESFESDEKLQELSEETKENFVSFEEITDDVVPRVNGKLDQAWQIDGDEMVLKPVRGITYDADRPIFSSSASWLLGRNIHPLDDEQLELLQLADTGATWGEMIERYAETQGTTSQDARVNLGERLQPLCEEQFILFRRGAA